MRDKENLRQWRLKYQEWARPAAKKYQLFWYRKNKAKLQEKFAKNYRMSAEQIRARNLKQYYGITLSDYAALLEKQLGRCAICHISQTKLSYRLHVDHNHATKEVRGLLCHHCNFGLGSFFDNPEFLVQAIAYLKTVAEVCS